MSLIYLSTNHMKVGHVMPHSAYNSDGILLLAKNNVLTQEQFDKLKDIDLFYDDKEGFLPHKKVSIKKKDFLKDKEKDEKEPKRLDFNKIKINIGSHMWLQINDGISNEKFDAKYIGFLANKGIMLSAPENSFGEQIFIKDNQSFILRFIHGKNCYAFTAQLLKVVNQPFQYIILSFPKEVIGIPVRQSVRANVKIIGVLSNDTEKDKKNIPVIIKNLSSTGCLISNKKSNAKCFVGDKFILKFKIIIENIEHIYNLPVKIRTISEDSFGDLEYGVSFEDLSLHEVISLSAYVYKVLLDSET